MRLDELNRTGYARRAVDGRRDVGRCTTADLGKIVRNSQIYATCYVWTAPIALVTSTFDLRWVLTTL